MKPSAFITTLTAVTVLIVWAGAFLDGAAQHEWTAFVTTTPVVAILAGFAFSVKVVARQKDGDE